MRRAIPLLLVCVGSLPAQESKPAEIGGRCVDDEKNPVARAKVHLYVRDYVEHRTHMVRSTISDDEGRFVFEGMPRIRPADYGWTFYYLVAKAKGHAVAVASIRDEKIRLGELELRMRTPADLTGVVRDDAGRHLPGARVFVMGIDAVADVAYNHVFLPEPNVLLRTETDAKGRFVLADLPKDAVLQVRADEPLHAYRRIRCSAPGEVEFELVPGGIATGRVVFPDGKPAAFVRVAAQGTRGSHGWATAKTDEKGRFELRSLPEGSYNIWAEKKDWTVKAHDSFAVTAGRRNATPDLKLVRGGFITGRVVDVDTGKGVRPHPSADVGIYGPSRPRSGAAIEAARIQPDGTFRIRVAPGQTYIYLRPHSAEWTKGTARYVDVEEGQTVEIEFEVQKKNRSRGR